MTIQKTCLKSFFLIIALSFTCAPALAKSKTSRKAKAPRASIQSKVPRASAQPRVVAPQAPTVSAASQKMLSEALNMAKNSQYEQAAVRLFALSRRADLAEEKMQIKYILGVCLLEMKLYQTAAFQFVDVIRNGNSKYTKQSIEKLSIAADELSDDTLLNYAVTKVQLDDFPEKYKDMIYYRLGEIKLKNGQFDQAAQAFGKVGTTSRYFAQAKFNRGRAFLENKQTNEALRAFQSLLASRGSAYVTDTNRVAAEVAIARTYYQAQQWDEALEWYRKVPRDTDLWHEVLFEESWADLRAAKFRSALSNFQSLHSSYYEDYYIPESLLLRAIVYLYICKYDEMDKVLGLFEKTYGPVRASLGEFMAGNQDPMTYYQEVERAVQIRKDGKAPSGLRIPYVIARHITNEGNVKRAFSYIRNLNEEKRRLDSLQTLSKNQLGAYANKIISNRVRNTRVSIGEMARNHIVSMRNELHDLYEQAGFIRYEMINGQKEQLKKKIAGKDISSKQIDENVNREFYIQNGYEYWPFDGEYWLDEIGNYHYLGKQSCE